MVTDLLDPMYAEPEEALEPRLVEAIQPFRGLALACALHASFDRGVYDALDEAPRDVESLAADLSVDAERLDALLLFLNVEGVVAYRRGGLATLTQRGREYGVFRAWYEMLVGGYAGVFAHLSEGLAGAASTPPRRGASVARGSAGVSLLCSLPLVRRLLAQLPAPPNLILDVGCGSPEYLARICDEQGCTGIGLEPDPDAVQAGREALASRPSSAPLVRVEQASAQTAAPALNDQPDLVLTAFVLHEVLGQDGERGVRAYLRTLRELAPAAHLLVIEVDWRPDDPSVMRHGYANGYYNGYYLLHPFTHQRLAPQASWEALFASEGMEIVAHGTTDETVDSTGLELGWLLRASTV
jgi:SAM-dependent methyltransferase